MRVLLFGATGMAGRAVFEACLASPVVTQVRTITRRPLADPSRKFVGVVHGDLRDYSEVEPAFQDVDVCLFCVGISSTQVPEESAYREITHDFPLAAAAALRYGSPAAQFQYLSGDGAGLNSRFMWARVKAEAERDLVEAYHAVCWRPVAIGAKASKNTPFAFKIVFPFFPLLQHFRSLYVSGADLGNAMIQANIEGTRSRVIKSAEIRDFADRYRATHRVPRATVAR
jgi:uncharacterized protein YbjT (DUF2867 family)